MHSSPTMKPESSRLRTRLGIVHFLAWMVGSALMLAMFRRFDISVGGQITPLRAVVYLFYGLTYGAALAGLLVLVAAGLDLTRQATRDWLHWVGVLVELATIAWIVFGVFGGLSVFL